MIQNLHVPSTVKFVKAARMCEQSQSSRHLTCCRASKRHQLSDWNFSTDVSANMALSVGTERVKIPCFVSPTVAAC